MYKLIPLLFFFLIPFTVDATVLMKAGSTGDDERNILYYTPNSTIALGEVTMSLARSPNSFTEDYLEVKIYQMNYPVGELGSLVAQDRISIATIQYFGTTYTDYIFDFEGAILTAGQGYAFVFDVVDAVGNFENWSCATYCDALHVETTIDDDYTDFEYWLTYETDTSENMEEAILLEDMTEATTTNDYVHPIITIEGDLNANDYVLVDVPCTVDSRLDTVVMCDTGSEYDSWLDIEGELMFREDSIKLEINLFNYDNQLLDSIANIYYGADTYNFSETLYNVTPSTTYRVSACLVPLEGTSFYGYGECADFYFLNGSTTPWFAFVSSLLDDSTTTTESLWYENGCDDLGITDVFKGAKCALIWAFAPNAENMNKLITLRDDFLHIIPIGYLTLIYEDIEDIRNATTTDHYAFAMPVYNGTELVASGTVVSLGGIANSLSDVDPGGLFTFFEYMIYVVFAFWVIRFVSTLRHKEET